MNYRIQNPGKTGERIVLKRSRRLEIVLSVILTPPGIFMFLGALALFLAP